VRCFKESARQNDVVGLTRYGCCLLGDYGGPEDLENAVSCLRNAADRGYPLAQLRYGACLISPWRNVNEFLPYLNSFILQIACQNAADLQYEMKQVAEMNFGTTKALATVATHFKSHYSSSEFCYLTCLKNGLGVQKNVYEAMLRFQQLIQRIDPCAQVGYGECLLELAAAQANPLAVTEAVENFKLAASCNDTMGQLRYGECLRDGIGGEQDRVLAAYYFKLAADQGNAEGQAAFWELWLGDISQDERRTALFFKLFADKSEASGQYSYGVCLRDGRGEPQDLSGALHYFKLAAAQGHEQAKHECKLLSAPSPSELKVPVSKTSSSPAKRGTPAKSSTWRTPTKPLESKDFGASAGPSAGGASANPPIEKKRIDWGPETPSVFGASANKNTAKQQSPVSKGKGGKRGKRVSMPLSNFLDETSATPATPATPVTSIFCPSDDD
jgi:TPR repeat protein